MGATFFQDFTRDNGLPITVEYGVDGSYAPTTYSPRFGAEGGDFPEFAILKAWPNTPWHNRLAAIDLRFWPKASTTRTGGWLVRKLAAPVRGLMALDEWWRASLTDSERERFEAWLAEHHVEPDYEPEFYP